MSLINSIIPPRAFEAIRDRIGAILFVEISNQADLSYEPEIDADVWIERVIPFNHTELPAINVRLAQGDFSGQTQVQTDGVYNFEIAVFTKAPSSDGVNGDVESVFRLHRLLGLCQAILEDTRYKRLAFPIPSIPKRWFNQLVIHGPAQQQDAMNVSSGHLSFNVQSPENPLTINALVMDQAITTVQLELTDLGYKYIHQE